MILEMRKIIQAVPERAPEKTGMCRRHNKLVRLLGFTSSRKGTPEKMSSPIVVLKQGKLLGKLCKDIDGNVYYSFKGIPYAQPPLGKLRFKAPLPPSSWKGILDATKNGNCCYAKDLFSKKFVGSEDCLNLNVYTSSISAKRDLKPVMVWIHGGGFTCGSNSSEIYGPEFLITANVVIVSINYRLGMLGFLSLENPSLNIPGNAGFKDMIMALKWVKNNIGKFDGDSNNVTIFGESAGGAAVHLLTLSPMAKGLFHKAISQSGCALNPWSRGKRFDTDMRKIFECVEMNGEDMVTYLQHLPIEKILEFQSKINYYLDPNKVSPFGFIVENDNQLEFPFITEEPLDIILSKKFSEVPFMIGYTKYEGMVVNTYKPERIVNMINDFECNVPYLLGYKYGSEKSKILGQEIKRFYFNGEEPNKNNKYKFYDMVTDILFLHGIVSTVRKHSTLSSSPVYFYRMSLETSLKFLKVLTSEEEPGAAHGDDIAYLFKSIFTPLLPPNSLEYISIKRFVKLWTNFAYYGNPVPKEKNPLSLWKPVLNDKQLCLLDIGAKLEFYDNLQFPGLQFWDKIYSESPMGFKFT